MIHFALIGIALMLLGGFLLLTAFERKQGTRVLGGARNRLDRFVARAGFVAARVDWSAFARHLAGTAFERVAHDAASASLRAVRAVEHALTRAVRSIRERRGLPPDEGSEPATNPVSRGIARVRAALRSARR